MAYPEDVVPSPLPLRMFVELLAEAKCESFTTKVPMPCFEADNRVPFGKWAAGNACVPCMAKAVLAGRLTIGFIPDPPREEKP